MLKSVVAVLGLLVAASAAKADPLVIPTHDFWASIPSQDPPDTRIFRRYTMKRDKSGMANVLMLQCPKDTGSYVYLSVELRSILNGAPLHWQPNLSIRFLVDAKHSFSLPAEVGGTEIFVDRTPDTQDQFDAIMHATTFIMALGNDQIGFRWTPRTSEGFAKVLPMMGLKATFLSTDEALDACRGYREDRAIRQKEADAAHDLRSGAVLTSEAAGRLPVQPAVQPPSILSDVPVTRLAASDAR